MKNKKYYIALNDREYTIFQDNFFTLCWAFKIACFISCFRSNPMEVFLTTFGATSFTPFNSAFGIATFPMVVSNFSNVSSSTYRTMNWLFFNFHK